MIKSYKYWYKDECAVEAKKFTSRSEFKDKATNAYRAALRHCWLEEIVAHMPQLIKPDGYWTLKKCREVARHCTTRMELKKKYSGAYNAIVENGWLDVVCGDMVKPQAPNKFWTLELCIERALKFKYRKEFEIGDNAAYQAAQKYGWLDEVCKNMCRMGSKTLRLIYSAEFRDKSVYVGLTCNYQRRVHDHLENRRMRGRSTVYKHIVKTSLQPEFKTHSDYIDVYSAVELEAHIVKQYKNMGWEILNKIKTGGLGGGFSIKTI